MLVHDLENPPHQLVAFEIGQVAQLGGAAQVSRIERIAPGAAQWTFFRDFDG
jgi:hypothetical protein